VKVSPTSGSVVANVPTWLPLGSFSVTEFSDSWSSVGIAFAEGVRLQSSCPFSPSSARKYNVPFKLISEPGKLEDKESPGRISRTITVPADVPSLLQSSEPVMPLLARKKRVPFTFVRDLGELEPPDLMVRTKTVPDEVPSLFQS
jgi:hypothetical protein